MLLLSLKTSKQNIPCWLIAQMSTVILIHDIFQENISVLDMDNAPKALSMPWARTCMLCQGMRRYFSSGIDPPIAIMRGERPQMKWCRKLQCPL